MQKIILSDQETGKSYSIELETERAKAINGTRIGKRIDASSIGLPKYEIQITGGSDKDGFPMRPDVPGRSRRKALLSGGPCYRPKSKGIKRRKSVRGNIVTQDIVQINAKIVKRGTKSIEKLLGVDKEEQVAGEEKPPAEKKVTKEKAPKEKKVAKEKKPPKEEKPTGKEKAAKAEKTEAK